MKNALKPHEVRELINAVTKVVTDHFKTPPMTRDIIAEATIDHLVKNGLYAQETARDPLRGELDINSFEEIRKGFEEMHQGRNLNKHYLRNTFTSPQIAALFNQHVLTVKWVMSNSNHNCSAEPVVNICFGTACPKRNDCCKRKKYNEIDNAPRYKKFNILSRSFIVNSQDCINNNYSFFETN